MEAFNIEQEAAKLKETLDSKLNKTDFDAFKTSAKEEVINAVSDSMVKAGPEFREKMISIVNEELEAFSDKIEKMRDTRFDPEKVWDITEKGNDVIMKTTWHQLARKKMYDAQVQKAVTTLTDIAGAPTDMGTIWTPQTGGNRFRPFITIQDVVGDSFSVVKLNEFAFETRATSVAAFTDGTTAAETLLTVGTYELLHRQSMPSIDDVAQYIPSIETGIMRADAKHKGAAIFAAIKASVNAATGFAEVATGVATTLPAAGDIIGKLADMSTAIGTDYMDGAVWHMARAVISLIRKAVAGNNGDFAYDPATGTNTLWGQSIVPNDRMEDGAAANRVSVAYGSFMDGIVLGERSDLTVTSNPYTNPGNQTFYAQTRYKETVNDTGAIVGLRTKA